MASASLLTVEIRFCARFTSSSVERASAPDESTSAVMLLSLRERARRLLSCFKNPLGIVEIPVESNRREVRLLIGAKIAPAGSFANRFFASPGLLDKSRVLRTFKFANRLLKTKASKVLT